MSTTVPQLPPLDAAGPPVVAFSPSRFSGVRTRRIFASLLDAVIIVVLQMVAFGTAVLLALPTMGFSLALIWVALQFGLVMILYCGLTIGTRRQATFGMRLFGLMVVRRDGGRPDFIQGACHPLLFYLSISFLTPAVLVVGLFDSMKRLLHDLVLDVVIVRKDETAAQAL